MTARPAAAATRQRLVSVRRITARIACGIPATIRPFSRIPFGEPDHGQPASQSRQGTPLAGAPRCLAAQWANHSRLLPPARPGRAHLLSLATDPGTTTRHLD